MTRTRIRIAPRLPAVAAIAAAMVVMASSVAIASVTMHGTYTTPTQQGTITFSPTRAFRGGMEGNFVVGGKRYPGSEYAAVGGGTGLVWYYGTSGNTAGNALVTLEADGSYSGPVWFFNRAGATTDSGTMTVTFP